MGFNITIMTAPSPTGDTAKADPDVQRAAMQEQEGRRLRQNYPDIQGILLSGYGHLKHAAYVFLQFPRADMSSVRTTAEIAEALAATASTLTIVKEEPDKSRRQPTAVNLALTFHGLEALGLTPETLETFPPEFRGGMTAPFRARALGDIGSADPGHWEWGGYIAPRTDAAGNSLSESPEIDTARAPDLLLMCFASSAEGLTGLITTETERWTALGAATIAVEQSTPHMEGEHFGFRDGITGVPIAGGFDSSKSPDAQQTIMPGEFVLGYLNEYDAERSATAINYDDQYALSPCLAGPAFSRRPGVSGADDPADIGYNGSYLVFRKLAQNVPAFWDYCRQQAKGLLPPTPAANALQETAGRIAAKMVGRWRSGAPLALCPFADSDAIANDPAQVNAFGYAVPIPGQAKQDPMVYACPVGAHIRRANPRNAMPQTSDPTTSLQTVAHHRILRRGRPYGTPYGDAAKATADPASLPGAKPTPSGDRGLLFFCIGTGIARQFEFVQQSWINNPKFGGLWAEPDPITGSAENVTHLTDTPGADAEFTIPQASGRVRLHGVPRFVTVRAGVYLFVPGITALQRIAAEARKRLT